MTGACTGLGVLVYDDGMMRTSPTYHMACSQTPDARDAQGAGEPAGGPVSDARKRRRLAYFSAQAVVEGQDSWAAVMEVVGAMRSADWDVEIFCPEYPSGARPGVLTRLRAIGSATRRLGQAIRSFDALYVRAHPLAWGAARRADKAGLPVIHEVNGSWDDAFAAWPWTRAAAPVVIAAQRAQYRSAAALIAVSEGIAGWLEQVTGRSDVVVSPNGANARLFRPGLPKPQRLPETYVVFFGQFAPWQRIDVLLEAHGCPSWPADVHLVIVGDGAARPLVDQAAARDERIYVLGMLPYADVAPVVASALAAAVLTYAPERAGYSPLKLYEAMACGVPVICSDTPGQAEYVRAEQAGIVVPPLDPDAVAGAVAELAADPARAREMGARGRQAIEERYSWEARALQRLGVVEEVVDGRRARDQARGARSSGT